MGIAVEVGLASQPDPELGGHDFKYIPYQSTSDSTITTDAITTQASGSTLVVGMGRRTTETAAPVDNKGNTYTIVGSQHAYSDWPPWATSVWADESISGGSGHTITADVLSMDEITLFAIEVKNGGRVQDYAWAENVNQSPLVSGSVTTTGPALLIAFWFGNGDENMGAHTAAPNNSFTVLHAQLQAGNALQGAVATKFIDAAGTYNVSWTSNNPGGQTWLVAVEG